MNLLIKETVLQRIMRKTGRKPCQCKCSLCKEQCHTPCLGTPEDIEKIIDAGYGDKLESPIGLWVSLWELPKTSFPCYKHKPAMNTVYSSMMDYANSMTKALNLPKADSLIILPE